MIAQAPPGYSTPRNSHTFPYPLRMSAADGPAAGIYIITNAQYPKCSAYLTTSAVDEPVKVSENDNSEKYRVCARVGVRLITSPR